MTNNILNEKYTIEAKYNMLNKFLETVKPIEETIANRVKAIRNQAIVECNEDKYMETISIEKEFKRNKIETMNNIYNANSIDEAIQNIDSFINVSNNWMYCENTVNYNNVNN